MQIAPLMVALPLAAAALLEAVSRLVPPRVGDAVALGTAIATAIIGAVLLQDAVNGRVVHWFGGWTPRHGLALGIAFSADAAGCSLALAAAVLTATALVFSWAYFDEAGVHYHALMLAFLAGMNGFALTGDLFNLFVFFELMGAAGYALTSLHVEEAGPIQGSLAFAVTNTVGAMFTLVGIAIVYGRTGALNLAQIGVALTSRPADHLVAIAFTLVAIGFLVKGALVPFHFWLSHAHAVAPSPVCVLLSGVMCELGAYAVARIYWTGFAGALPADRAPVVETLLVLGVGTALVGGAMALLERHLKRLLAFSTISYMGVFLTGVALLDRDGLAGALLAMLAHGFAKAALFLVAGVLLYRYGSVDELELQGRGRHDRLPMAIFALALVALAAPPLVGTFAGKSLIDDSAASSGHPLVAPLLTVAALLSTAAIARAGARIFLGVGPHEDPMLSPQPVERSEIAEAPRRPSGLMTLPALLLALLAVVLPLVPGLEELARHAATVFEDQNGTVAQVLRGRPGGALPPRAGGLPEVTAAGVVYALIASLGGLLLAAAALGRGTIGRGVRRVAGRGLQPLRAIHTGHLGDDIAWAIVGAAALTAALALGLD